MSLVSFLSSPLEGFRGKPESRQYTWTRVFWFGVSKKDVEVGVVEANWGRTLAEDWGVDEA